MDHSEVSEHVNALVDACIAKAFNEYSTARPPEENELLSDRGLTSVQLAVLVLDIEEQLGCELADHELRYEHWATARTIKDMLMLRYQSI